MMNFISMTYIVSLSGKVPLSFSHLTKAREQANGWASLHHNNTVKIHDKDGVLKETYLYADNGITHWKRLDL